MAPRRVSNPGLTLGFYGSGQTSLKGAVALVEDLIEANGGKARVVIPATEDAWSEGIETVADWALDAGHPLEVITDDTSGKHKGVKPFLGKASKTHKSAVAGTKLAQVLGENEGKLIVFWDDENDTLYDVIEAADEVGVEAFDICAGLEKIELSDEPVEEEKYPDMADDLAEDQATDEEEGDEITEEYLAARDDADIEALADEFGIDPEAYEDWDEVRQAILLAARAQAEGDEEPTPGGLPTEAEIADWDFDTLKAFATEHNIDVAPRSRTSGYRTAVLGWLGQQDAEEGYVAPPDEEVDLPGDLGGIDPDALVEAVVGALRGALQDTLDSLGQQVGRLGMSVDRLTTEVNESYAQINAALDAITKAPAPSQAPQKATSAPQKAAAAKKAPSAPTKSVSAPGAVQPPKTEGEKVMASVLKWADADVVTKVTATKILDLWEQRPKGRPTERERKLHALARSVIPEEKRPVGRPRKTS